MRARPGIGVVNFYEITEAGGTVGYQDTTGRTSTSPSITGGEKTLLVFIIDQSTGANDQPTPNTVTNTTKLQQLDPYNGTVYRAADPQLGPNGSNGCWYTKAFDTLITNGKFARIIMSNAARSGVGSVGWRGFRLPQGDFYQQVMVHVRRARSLGYFLPNVDLSIAVQTGFGVTDGTTGVTSPEYQANVLDLLAGMQDQGLPTTAKMFINVSTMDTNVVSATIEAAQAALVNNPANRYAGANLDSLTGATNRRADGTHFTDTGSLAAAALLVTAYSSVY